MIHSKSSELDDITKWHFLMTFSDDLFDYRMSKCSVFTYVDTGMVLEILNMRRKSGGTPLFNCNFSTVCEVVAASLLLGRDQDIWPGGWSPVLEEQLHPHQDQGLWSSFLCWRETNCWEPLSTLTASCKPFHLSGPISPMCKKSPPHLLRSLFSLRIRFCKLYLCHANVYYIVPYRTYYILFYLYYYLPSLIFGLLGSLVEITLFMHSNVIAGLAMWA